jgi:spore maturation protein CgeB
MNILYLAPRSGTSYHRAEALKRLGHRITYCEQHPSWMKAGVRGRYVFHTSAFGLQRALIAYLERAMPTSGFDLIWVDQAPFYGPKVVSHLKSFGVPVISYLLDDPFAAGVRWRRFAQFRQAAHLYDLMSVPRVCNLDELRKIGVHRMLLQIFTADEVYHAPPVVSPSDRERLSSEVCMIGTYFPERGEFALELIRAGVPLSIWGANWQKFPKVDLLGAHLRGGNLDENTDYAKGIALSKLALCLPSKQNRDQMTSRSSEIPAIGGLLVAQQSEAHAQMYRNGEEAVFFDDAASCAAICTELLNDPARRERIRLAGMARVRASQYYNEPAMARILTLAMEK